MSIPDVLIINPPIRLSDKPRHIPHGLAILANIIRDSLGILLDKYHLDEKDLEHRAKHGGMSTF